MCSVMHRGPQKCVISLLFARQCGVRVLKEPCRRVCRSVVSSSQSLSVCCVCLQAAGSWSTHRICSSRVAARHQEEPTAQPAGRRWTIVLTGSARSALSVCQLCLRCSVSEWLPVPSSLYMLPAETRYRSQSVIDTDRLHKLPTNSWVDCTHSGINEMRWV